MARRRRGKIISGWLAVDKPLEITSSTVVNQVRRLLDAAKAGHGGTLDPLATGVLPIAFGEATKTVAYVMDGSKSYRVTLKFGESRTTDDAEGDVNATSDHRPTREEIEAVLCEFTGEIQQVPPKFSAIKVNGKRAYDLARRDEDVVLKARPILIKDLRLVDMPDRDHAVFDVISGKGAYMRSLARDIALRLGSVGHISALRRTSAGPFAEGDSIPLQTLLEMDPEAVMEKLLPVETALDDIPALALTEVEAQRLASGQPVGLLAVAKRSELGTPVAQDGIVCAMLNDRAVALAEIHGGEIRPVRVFNL
ncbi:tRNA pseudouridine(55) synthase TruB [Thalassospira mesophila]|uniref:tRNA pseudouridine synthase B n=1 Tax=Thalassospira mesophila TaxID=1293891 RepID=A0A1Y2L3C5_9PROT|nr:tRNA pseudouridine(55) synthase TruB [Thalassospira mesophila]OSQ40325.1 pseudouridine synthase [Thalassospira mesophila]